MKLLITLVSDRLLPSTLAVHDANFSLSLWNAGKVHLPWNADAGHDHPEYSYQQQERQ
jgi:hypothetical protein